MRWWEIAGAADGDTYLFISGLSDLGHSSRAADLLLTPFICTTPINSAPQHHFVANAAIASLNRWVRQGSAPESASRIETAGDLLLRDAHGNALGGIRTPQLDVPIATLSGDAPDGGSFFCFAFGATVPFDDAELRALYPDHERYVSAFDAATDRAVAAGFLLPPDADLMKVAAEQSDIGR